MSFLLAWIAGLSRQFFAYFLMAVLALLASAPSYAKTIGLTAIEIYPGASGQSYIQLTELVLNAKNEVYLCGNAASFEKSAYHKLEKVTLGPGMSLEMDAKGGLVLSSAPQPPACAVPGNLKLEGSGPFSAADLSSKAHIESRVLPGSDPVQAQPVQFKAGVLLVFVAAPDQEFAEYLRASRASEISQWKDYLGKYASGAHSSAARKALAALYLPIGNSDLKSFETTAAASDPDFARLKEARQMADQAHTLAPDDAAAADLGKNIHEAVVSLSAQSRAKLDAYEQALKSQTAGYINLVAAEMLADGAFSVEPATSQASEAENRAKLARVAFDKIVRDSEGQLAARHTDDAVQTMAPIRAFAPENAKIASDLQAIAAAYVSAAKESEDSSNWPDAVTELEKAQAIVPSPDTASMLSEARFQGVIAANKAAAEAAMHSSQDAESRSDIIAAYEVLDDLPPDQHALVANRLETLKDAYVKEAELAAKRETSASSTASCFPSSAASTA